MICINEACESFLGAAKWLGSYFYTLKEQINLNNVDISYSSDNSNVVFNIQHLMDKPYIIDGFDCNKKGQKINFSELKEVASLGDLIFIPNENHDSFTIALEQKELPIVVLENIDYTGISYTCFSF